MTSTSSAPPHFSFDTTAPPPALANSGTDYTRIALSLLQYSDWLYAHRPDDSLARQILAPGTRLERSIKDDFATLRMTNRRLFELTSRADDLHLISASKNAATVGDLQYLTGVRIVNRLGKIVSAAPRTPTNYIVLLVRGAGDRWYLGAVDKTAS